MPLKSTTTHSKKGFTLVEVMAALLVLLTAVTLALGGFLFMQKNHLQQVTQNNLDTDLNLAARRLQKELRLSSLSEMTFFPSTAKKYTGISFPIQNSGSINTNQSGTVEWDTTVIYHVVTDNADSKLMRTTFSPRNNSLSVVERQAQLDEVAYSGDGKSAKNGANSITTALFEHLLTWEVIPQGSSYDGYAEKLLLDKEANLGSFNLKPGLHTLKITAIGKSSASSGYLIGMDTVSLSSSGIKREAEAQNLTGSPLPTKEYNASGAWSGYQQLSFTPTTIGDSFELSFYNDRWEETNFEIGIGSKESNTVVGVIDTSYSPPDFTLRLFGSTTNWTPEAQTGNLGTCLTNETLFSGSIVRTIILGEEIQNGVALEHDGAGCRIAFSGGMGPSSQSSLYIAQAYIAECELSSDTPPKITQNTIGIPVKITFNNNSFYKILGTGTVWSDTLKFPISKKKCYAVTYKIKTGVTKNIFPKIWKHTSGAAFSFVIAGTNGAVNADLTRKNWSGRGATNLPYVIGISGLFTTFPEKGTFTSPPMDTRMPHPKYATIEWTEDRPAGTSLGIKVRSARNSNMSDARLWSTISEEPSPGSLNSIRYERYLQYRVELRSNSKGLDTPKLRDLAIQWPGETRAVDIGGTFVNGSDYGQFKAEIDGQPLASPLRISIELEQPIYGMNATTEIMKSKTVFEISPKNTKR